ncbi:MAG: RNA-binding S4 domain-containing protein [Bacteroidetes bacterium]|nr:RNA-binding S4 domain-containing protein [Bacteroidota bacterium]MBU1580978.1 RNA-binding S4 domain-containing protein [Bacteroidota bacterium]MBU2466101.1 RNA-binding S4 domain-containing protein [Bacteroidota bacterium]MBU2557588.1 RNA-binding S4 domain-containing protein [Bacteroidota bacterium]
MSEGVRIDKWLWAARIFKTRNIAAEACKGGKVKMDEQAVKASREIKVGDVIAVQVNQLHKTVEVKAAVKNRVSAKMVEDVLIDRTPTEEYERYEMVKAAKTEFRGRGLGRPTKKERRLIDKLKND